MSLDCINSEHRSLTPMIGTGCVTNPHCFLTCLSGAFGLPRAFISHRLKKHTQPDGLRILVPNALIEPSKSHPIVAQPRAALP
jgi:hypothetical protein